jgi:hypothetical protein
VLSDSHIFRTNVVRKSGRKEAYNLDHAVLNMKPPETLWLNMGYWKVEMGIPALRSL